MSVFISPCLLSAQSPKQLKVHLRYIFYRFMHSLQTESMNLALVLYFNHNFKNIQNFSIRRTFWWRMSVEVLKGWMFYWTCFYECCLTTNLVQFILAFSCFSVKVFKYSYQYKKKHSRLCPSNWTKSESLIWTLFLKLILQKDKRNYHIFIFL